MGEEVAGVAVAIAELQEGIANESLEATVVMERALAALTTHLPTAEDQGDGSGVGA